jgi:hypothetical protein
LEFDIPVPVQRREADFIDSFHSLASQHCAVATLGNLGWNSPPAYAAFSNIFAAILSFCCHQIHKFVIECVYRLHQLGPGREGQEKWVIHRDLQNLAALRPFPTQARIPFIA